jgi:dihydroorotase
MSVRAASIGSLAGHGRPLEAGEPANLTLVDPAASRTIEPDALHSRSRNTPFAGLKLPGAVHATFLRGTATVLDGKVIDR